VNPCEGCPCEPQIKVAPVIPSNPKIIAVGIAPGRVEEELKLPFQGESGQLLRKVLKAVGLDPEKDVGYANLGRCRPPGDDFDTSEWKEAEKRCWSYLMRDLQGWDGPLLLLSDRTVQKFLHDGKARLKTLHGTWEKSQGWNCFLSYHPARVIRTEGVSRITVEQGFRDDLARMAARVLGSEDGQPYPVRFHVFSDPLKASGFLGKLKESGGPHKRFWFDIETGDAQGVPSRKAVATDPFHPQFRVRGVAIALSPEIGAWIELRSWEDRKGEASKILTPVFMSEWEKGAFYGSFDENGLIVPGWVEGVRNRTRDPYLAAIALDETGHGHSLERLCLDLLGISKPKGKVDPQRIMEMSVEEVAEYAVRDCCLAWALDDALQARLDKGEYY